MRKTLTAILLLIALATQAQTGKNYGRETAMRKLQIATLAIENLYVDEVNQDSIVESAIIGMLAGLDPHSSYSTAKETQQFAESINGSFDGIGVQFNMDRDTLLVIQPVLDGPSEKAGIQAGDRIISVNDTTIAGVKLSTDKITQKLRGKKGTKVKLGILRRGIPEVLYFQVTRDKIPIKTVSAAYLIRPNVGYIRIESFGMTTYEEFMKSVQSLKKKGMKDLIIDLKENGGGLMQSAILICNEFLQKNDLIVYTKGRNSEKQEFRAKGDGKLLDGKVVVLINEFSASASEIVTGALQDQDRATIIGRLSFGKGLVQKPFEFNDGSMMRITVAHYYTPSGRCIQKPYKKGDALDYQREILQRFEHGEMYSKDSIQTTDSLKYHTLRKKRVVYGGGGIMPDIFTPIDTTLYTEAYRKISAKRIVLENTVRYMDQNRKELKSKYADFETFKKQFEVPKQLIDKVYADAEKEKIKVKDDREKAQTDKNLRLIIKALIARDIWDMSEYFSIVNEDEPGIRQALEVLSKPQLSPLATKNKKRK